MPINRLDLIIERLDRILELLENKKNNEPLLTFSKANPNADDSNIKERQNDIFSSLDSNKKVSK